MHVPSIPKAFPMERQALNCSYVSWSGEKEREQPNHKWYGNQGENETGNKKLIDDGPVSSRPFCNKGDSRDRWYSALQHNKQGNMIWRANDQQDAKENQREDDVFDDDEFYDFSELRLAFVLKIQVDVAAQYDHEKGHRHTAHQG